MINALIQIPLSSFPITSSIARFTAFLQALSEIFVKSEFFLKKLWTFAENYSIIVVGSVCPDAFFRTGQTQIVLEVFENVYF